LFSSLFSLFFTCVAISLGVKASPSFPPPFSFPFGYTITFASKKLLSLPPPPFSPEHVIGKIFSLCFTSLRRELYAVASMPIAHDESATFSPFFLRISKTLGAHT